MGPFFSGGPPVSIEKILRNKERRVAFIEQLFALFPSHAILSLKCNIPGPIKTSPAICVLFEKGERHLESLFARRGWDVPYKKTLRLLTGPEAIYALPAPPVELKKTAILFEDGGSGRLFDADVHFAESDRYETLHREDLRVPERTCFLCHQNAKGCASRASHPQELLLARVEQLAAEPFGV